MTGNVLREIPRELDRLKEDLKALPPALLVLSKTAIAFNENQKRSPKGGKYAATAVYVALLDVLTHAVAVARKWEWGYPEDINEKERQELLRRSEELALELVMWEAPNYR